MEEAKGNAEGEDESEEFGIDQGDTKIVTRLVGPYMSLSMAVVNVHIAQQIPFPWHDQAVTGVT